MPQVLLFLFRTYQIAKIPIHIPRIHHIQTSDKREHVFNNGHVRVRNPDPTR